MYELSSFSSSFYSIKMYRPSEHARRAYLQILLLSVVVGHHLFLFFVGHHSFSSRCAISLLQGTNDEILPGADQSRTYLLNFDDHRGFLVLANGIGEEFTAMHLFAAEPERHVAFWYHVEAVLK